MKVNPSSFDSEDRNFRIAQKRAFTILKRRRDVMITELATQFPHKPVTFWVEEVDNAIKTIKLGLRIK